MRFGAKAANAGESVINIASVTAVNNFDMEEPSFWRGRKVGLARSSLFIEPTKLEQCILGHYFLVPKIGHVCFGSLAIWPFSASAD